MNILFVCTGNTCRSPMAAGIMAKLAEEDELDIKIESAGLFAQNGAPASPEAVRALEKYDIDISDHIAQQITDELIEKSDLIVTMTEAHKRLLENIAPEKTRTLAELCGLDEDIADPFGGDDSDYDKTADDLYTALCSLADKLYEIQENEKADKDE